MQTKSETESSTTRKNNRMGDPITIAIDFDGTIVMHEYPAVGAPNPGAIEWMKKFKEAGANIVLFTMRSDVNFLPEALDYIEEAGVTLDGINFNPGQESWTLSPKAYAQIYIDDAAFGCPLKIRMQNGVPVGRPYVNWDIVGPKVMESIIASQ